MKATVTRGYSPGEDSATRISPGISISLPVSKEQRLRQTLIAGLTGSVKINHEFQKLSVGGGLSATRNVHTYETKTNGALNTAYQLGLTGQAHYQISGRIGASLILTKNDTFSYFGGHREFYSHVEEFDFEINKTVALALGHQMSPSSIRKPNGEDYNIQLTDESQSLVYASVTFQW